MPAPKQPADAGREEAMIEIGAEHQAPPVTARVSGMTMRVKKITATDDGKLQVTLETEGMDDHALAQVEAMLVLQQSCLVNVSMLPTQRDLFEA